MINNVNIQVFIFWYLVLAVCFFVGLLAGFIHANSNYYNDKLNWKVWFLVALLFIFFAAIWPVYLVKGIYLWFVGKS